MRRSLRHVACWTARMRNVLFSLLLVACGSSGDTFDTSKSYFHVTIGNRIAIINSLDVTVWVDDAQVFTGLVASGDGNQWTEKVVNLKTGAHSIKAATKGSVVVWTGTFTMPTKPAW